MMRAIKLLVGVLLAVWALLTAYLVFWLRARSERSPCPASQAGELLHPLRGLIHPVGRTLEKFRLKAGDTVLELGPGPGYFTVEASRMVGSNGRVICVDLQPAMLRLLNERLEEERVANAGLAAGDAANLPLVDNSVNGAFLVTVLGEVPDRPRAMVELRRVLKPGGVLSISESLTDPDYMFEDSLRDLCRASGFEVLDHSRELLGYTMCFTAP